MDGNHVCLPLKWVLIMTSYERHSTRKNSISRNKLRLGALWLGVGALWLGALWDWSTIINSANQWLCPWSWWCGHKGRRWGQRPSHGGCLAPPSPVWSRCGQSGGGRSMAGGCIYAYTFRSREPHTETISDH